MALFEWKGDADLTPVEESTFKTLNIKEREHLQNMLRDHIDVIDEGLMVLAEEFGSFEESQRRIDLLCLDRDGNLVVVELKRTEDGGHMDLQAIRYAAMVSAMTFDDAVEAHSKYLKKRGKESGDARTEILNHLDWDETEGDIFASEIKIILVSGDFKKEITTSVLWLISRGIDLRCVKISPYIHEGKTLLNVQSIIPLPGAEQYQIQMRQKEQQEKKAKTYNLDFTRYDVSIEGVLHQSMTKRETIRKICEHLIHQDVTAEEITKTLMMNPTRLWRIMEGTLDEERFLEAAIESAKEKTLRFDPKRFFTDGNTLIYHDNKTYGLRNQWGGSTWQGAMEKLIETYSKYEISIQSTA